MNKIKVSNLKAGMKFTHPVFLDGTNLLVPERVEIRQKDLDRLAKWGIEEVSTDGTDVAEAPDSVEPDEMLEEVGDGDEEQGPLQELSTAAMHTNRIFDEIKNNRAIETDEIDGIVDNLIRIVEHSKDGAIEFVLQGDRSEPTLGLNAVNCCLLSIIIGSIMSVDAARLKILAIAAILHDVGMVRVPEAVIQKTANLTSDEIKQMRTHTLYTYQIIAKSLGFPEEIGILALQHHERWDGKGYPRRLAGKSIALEARILTVADSFEAMVKERPHRGPMIAYTAMRQMLNDNSKRFDPEILKHFIRVIGIYPLGSFILLNNGSIGRVIKVNGNAPLRPAVRLLVDKNGKKYEQDEAAELDLVNEKDIFVARAIDPNAVGAKKKA